MGSTIPSRAVYIRYTHRHVVRQVRMNTCLSVKVDRIPPPMPFSFSVTSATAGGNWQDPHNSKPRWIQDPPSTAATHDQQIINIVRSWGRGQKVAKQHERRWHLMWRFASNPSSSNSAAALHALYLAALIREHDHHSSRGPARRCLMSTDGVSGFSQDE